MTPSLASMRWMVGSESPDIAASLRWSIPSRARAARSCAPEIIGNRVQEIRKASYSINLDVSIVFIDGKCNCKLFVNWHRRLDHFIWCLMI
jgi:hypothetical protein